MSHLPPPGRRSGLSSLTSEDFSVEQAVGGVRGVVESVLPGVLFLFTFLISKDLRLALYLSIGAAALLALARLVTRASPVQALSGLVGVAICAWFASRSGDAKDYYIPGFWTNAIYGSVFLLSLVPLPGRTLKDGSRLPAGSYPLVGLIVGAMMGEGLRWRQMPARRRAYTLATLAYCALFASRLLVQVPLYLTDRFALLGAARLVMGVPLLALVMWLAWRLVRVPVRSGEAEQ